MIAARLHSYDPAVNIELQLEDVPDPKIVDPMDVIVRVGAAGLCRTDLHIIEGVWRPVMDAESRLLPYILGHENAGWVAEIGAGVRSVKVGDPVICHPLCTCGLCLSGCRRGEDMFCERSFFPGLNTDGGFASYVRTNERALVKLNSNVTPVDVAPLADAGITAYRAAKRAARLLNPGNYCVVLGIGGLGHIALQTLHALCSARTIAVDRSPTALQLAKDLGARHVLPAGDRLVDEIRELTQGGAHAVLDFVAERGAQQESWQMLRPGGTNFVVGYGGVIEVPAAHLVINEVAIAGSLVGNYMELVELMELNAEGRVKLHGQTYKLTQINSTIRDFKAMKIVGRAVIVPDS